MVKSWTFTMTGVHYADEKTAPFGYPTWVQVALKKRPVMNPLAIGLFGLSRAALNRFARVFLKAGGGETGEENELEGKESEDWVWCPGAKRDHVERYLRQTQRFSELHGSRLCTAISTVIPSFPHASMTKVHPLLLCFAISRVMHAFRRDPSDPHSKHRPPDTKTLVVHFRHPAVYISINNRYIFMGRPVSSVPARG